MSQFLSDDLVVWLACAVVGVSAGLVARWQSARRASSNSATLNNAGAGSERVSTPLPPRATPADWGEDDSAENTHPAWLAVIFPLGWTLLAYLATTLNSESLASHGVVLWAWALGLSWGALVGVATRAHTTAALGAVALAFVGAHFVSAAHQSAPGAGDVWWGVALILGTGAGTLLAESKNEGGSQVLPVLASLLGAAAWTRAVREGATWSLTAALALSAVVLAMLLATLIVPSAFARFKNARGLLLTSVGFIVAAGGVVLAHFATPTAAFVWLGGAALGTALSAHVHTVEDATAEDNALTFEFGTLNSFAARWAWPLGASLTLIGASNFALRGFGIALGALAATSVVVATSRAAPSAALRGESASASVARTESRARDLWAEAQTVAALGGVLVILRLLEARLNTAFVRDEFVLLWGTLAAALVPVVALRSLRLAVASGVVAGVWFGWGALIALQGAKIVPGVVLGAAVALVFVTEAENAVRRAIWSGLLFVGALAPLGVALADTARGPRVLILLALFALGVFGFWLASWTRNRPR